MGGQDSLPPQAYTRDRENCSDVNYQVVVTSIPKSFSKKTTARVVFPGGGCVDAWRALLTTF